jgi:hypothetical protein
MDRNQSAYIEAVASGKLKGKGKQQDQAKKGIGMQPEEHKSTIFIPHFPKRMITEDTELRSPQTASMPR